MCVEMVRYVYVYVHSAYLCVHTNPEYESMKLYKCDSTKDDSTKDDFGYMRVSLETLWSVVE